MDSQFTNLSVVAIFPIGSVADDLGPAVGKERSVFTFHNISVRLGLMSVINIFLLDLESKRFDKLYAFRVNSFNYVFYNRFPPCKKNQRAFLVREQPGKKKQFI